MNCWFCNTYINFIYNNDFQTVDCHNHNCQLYKVVYKFTNNKFNIAQFRSKLNNAAYIINYWIQEKQIVIVKQLPDLPNYFDLTNYQVVLQLPFERKLLTPINVDSKLPLLLLLS